VLCLTILDDGCGFDVAARRRTQDPGADNDDGQTDRNGTGTRTGAGRNGGGRGLANMESRAHALGGTCTVTSSPVHGCRITLRVP
jgi:signal transduction histidine kinase